LEVGKTHIIIIVIIYNNVVPFSKYMYILKEISKSVCDCWVV